jgi:hypothetical protein
MISGHTVVFTAGGENLTSGRNDQNEQKNEQKVSGTVFPEF